MNEPVLRLGFVVNDVATEQDNYTTIRLALIAIRRGHSVALIGLEDFIYDPSGVVHAKAHLPRESEYADDAALLADLQGEDATVERINVEELDVLMLRSDPAEEQVERLMSGKELGREPGFGVWGTIERLKLFYGVENIVRIESGEGRGTKISIRVPAREEDSDE